MNILIADRRAIQFAGCHGDTRGTFEIFWADSGDCREGVHLSREGWYVGVPDCECDDDLHGPYTTSEEAKTAHELALTP